VAKRIRLEVRTAVIPGAAVVGEMIVRSVGRRKVRVLVGSGAKAVSVIARVLPVSY
jgi:hypothetical protein